MRMQSRMPTTTMIVPEARLAQLEQRKPCRPARTEILVIAGVCLLAATPASAASGIGLGTGRLVPAVAAVVGLIGVVVGALPAANAAGGIGTGNGLAGAIVAMVVGLISMVLGALALTRYRR